MKKPTNFFGKTPVFVNSGFVKNMWWTRYRLTLWGDNAAKYDQENFEGKDYKIKTLHIEPGKSLSDQRHFKRNEHWFVLEGELSLNGDIYNKNDFITINHILDHNYSNFLKRNDNIGNKLIGTFNE